VHNIELDEREIFYHGDIYSKMVPVVISLSAGEHTLRYLYYKKEEIYKIRKEKRK
jgi:hypothetical protein